MIFELVLALPLKFASQIQYYGTDLQAQGRRAQLTDISVFGGLNYGHRLSLYDFGAKT